MFIPWEQGKQMGGATDAAAGGGLLGGYGPLADPNTLTTQQKIMQFLQSPEAMALGSSLLQQGQPSYTHTPSFSAGLGNAMGQMGDIQKYRNEQAFERDKLRQQRLLDQARLEILKGHLDVDKGKLSIEEAYKKAQMDDLIRKAESSAKQQQFYDALLYGEQQAEDGANGDGTGLLGDLTPEQRRRAAIAGKLGGAEAAAKILTEPNPSNSPTTATITATQEQLRSIDAAIPALEKLKTLESPDIPGVPGGSIISGIMEPKKTAISKKVIKDIAKDYLAAKQTNITDSSIKAAVDVLSRAPGETQEEYAERIDDMIQDLEQKATYAASVAKPVRDVKKKAAPQKKKKASEYSEAELWAIVNGEEE